MGVLGWGAQYEIHLQELNQVLTANIRVKRPQASSRGRERNHSEITSVFPLLNQA